MKDRYGCDPENILAFFMPAIRKCHFEVVKLHDVPPKTAAMLMAIVADKTGKPLNELRFISIKEVHE